jgi:hypothetical protein
LASWSIVSASGPVGTLHGGDSRIDRESSSQDPGRLGSLQSKSKPVTMAAE